MIRPAAAADVSAIVALLADDPHGRMRERPADLAPYLAAFAGLQRDTRSLLAVAEAPDGTIVGCIQLTFIPGLSNQGATRCQIEDVRVAAAHRREGLGRALLGFAAAEAKARGCRILQLFMHRDREGARDFYRAMGFAHEHDGWRKTL